MVWRKGVAVIPFLLCLRFGLTVPTSSVGVDTGGGSTIPFRLTLDLCCCCCCWRESSSKLMLTVSASISFADQCESDRSGLEWLLSRWLLSCVEHLDGMLRTLREVDLILDWWCERKFLSMRRERENSRARLCYCCRSPAIRNLFAASERVSSPRCNSCSRSESFKALWVIRWHLELTF